MRHRHKQRFTFDQRLADQAEFKIFKIPQPAVKQLGRGTGRCLRQITLFGQNDRQPAARSITRNAGTIDTTTDHKQIDGRHIGCLVTHAVSPLRCLA